MLWCLFRLRDALVFSFASYNFLFKFTLNLICMFLFIEETGQMRKLQYVTVSPHSPNTQVSETSMCRCYLWIASNPPHPTEHKSTAGLCAEPSSLLTLHVQLQTLL